VQLGEGNVADQVRPKAAVCGPPRVVDVDHASTLACECDHRRRASRRPYRSRFADLLPARRGRSL
jgi:hypothetical protein